jgi:AbrB family looped-hinge helix DNA binding protein
MLGRNIAMHSLITSKYQITIPKAVREKLKLSVHDALEWKIEEDKIVVCPVQQRFLQHRNSVKVGPGEIGEDIDAARVRMTDKYR